MAERSLIDLDRGTRVRLKGLPENLELAWTQQIGKHLVVTVDCVGCAPRPTVYVARAGRDSVTRIARGVFVAPARRGLWAMSFDTSTSCSLSRISLSGKVLDAPRPIDCAMQPLEETPHGLVVRIDRDYAIVDPRDLSEIVRWKHPSRVHAIVGNRALVSDETGFALVHLRDGTGTSLPRPDSFGHPGDGLVSRDGRFVALEFRHPDQIMDLWVLDVAERRWIRAPSVPVRAFIKRPEPKWTPDGRLVVVGTFGVEPNLRHLLVVWRPAESQLALRAVDADASYVVV